MYISVSNFPSIHFDPINQSSQSHFSGMEGGGLINAVYVTTFSEHQQLNWRQRCLQFSSWENSTVTAPTLLDTRQYKEAESAITSLEKLQSTMRHKSARSSTCSILVFRGLSPSLKALLEGQETQSAPTAVQMLSYKLGLHISKINCTCNIRFH